jgi:hypothetical protein
MIKVKGRIILNGTAMFMVDETKSLATTVRVKGEVEPSLTYSLNSLK